MKIEKISKIVSSVPWEKLGTTLPTPEDKKKLEAIKAALGDILVLLEKDQLDPELLKRLEAIAERFRCLGQSLESKTNASELYSKAKLNEILTWNVGHYAERAIFLAGRASVDKKIVEPYKTQILNQAVHACLLRYRLAANLRERIFARLDGSVSDDIDFLLKQLVGSLLSQLMYFSELAYNSDKEHALSGYHYVVANLVASYERKLAGHDKEAKSLAELARRAAQAIPEPRAGIHYMQKAYHQTNFTELRSFRRMSNQNRAIFDRFRHLSEAAQKLDGASVMVPREYFNIAWIVNTGTRSASIVSILVTLFAMTNLGYAQLTPALAEVWTNVAIILAPGDAQLITELQNTGSLAALNTGGLASVTANTGGLAEKISLFA